MGEKDRAALLISAAHKGSGRWLFNKSQWDYSVKFTPAEFRAALGVRLLLTPIPEPGAIQCACYAHQNVQVAYADSPFHPLSCAFNQSAVLKRHDFVRDRLFDFLKRVSPRDELVKERALEVVSGEGVRCDIWCRTGGLLYIIDVSVVEPSCRQYLELESWKRENVATERREHTKRLHYQRCRVLQADAGGVLVPFIMESTGRLGASALEFVSKFIVAHHLHTSLFLDHVAVGTARASGQMVNQARWNVGRIQVE